MPEQEDRRARLSKDVLGETEEPISESSQARDIALRERADVARSRRAWSSYRAAVLAATLLAYVAAGHLAVVLLGWGWAVLALAAGGAALGFAVVRREMARCRALEDAHLSQLEAADLLEEAE